MQRFRDFPLQCVAEKRKEALKQNRFTKPGGREERNFGRRQREREVVRMRVTRTKVAAEVPFLFTSPYSIPSFFVRPGSSSRLNWQQKPGLTL